MTTLEKLEELIYVGFKETDKKWQETDRKWQETEEWLRAMSAESEKKFQETREFIKQLSKESEKKIGDLSHKWGVFVKNLVAPATLQLFAARGIVVTRIAQHVREQRGDDGIEIDILATNGEYAVLIEVKSTLSVQDVNDHLERLQKFARFFPEYQQHHIVGAVAGIEIIEAADVFAYRQGLFVIAQSGETVKILNDEKFRPKIWRG